MLMTMLDRLFKSSALKRRENFDSLLKQTKILSTRFGYNKQRFEWVLNLGFLCVWHSVAFKGTRDEMPLYDILVENVVEKHIQDDS